MRKEEKKIIKWIRIEAGEYVSEDKRFKILKTWDRLYGNHWALYDKNEPDFYKRKHYEKTLLECKLKAEAIANND